MQQENQQLKTTLELVMNKYRQISMSKSSKNSMDHITLELQRERDESDRLRRENIKLTQQFHGLLGVLKEALRIEKEELGLESNSEKELVDKNARNKVQELLRTEGIDLDQQSQ